jgi:hypothetical protein
MWATNFEEKKRKKQQQQQTFTEKKFNNCPKGKGTSDTHS